MTKDSSQINIKKQKAKHKSILTMVIMRILKLIWTTVLCTVPVVVVNAWIPRSNVAERRVPTLLLASKETDSSTRTSTSIPTTIPSFLMETFNTEYDHARLGSISSVAREIGRQQSAAVGGRQYVSVAHTSGRALFRIRVGRYADRTTATGATT
jgi:hypothetical protein